MLGVLGLATRRLAQGDMAAGPLALAALAARWPPTSCSDGRRIRLHIHARRPRARAPGRSPSACVVFLRVEARWPVYEKSLFTLTLNVDENEKEFKTCYICIKFSKE